MCKGNYSLATILHIENILSSIENKRLATFRREQLAAVGVTTAPSANLYICGSFLLHLPVNSNPTVIQREAVQEPERYWLGKWKSQSKRNQ